MTQTVTHPRDTSGLKDTLPCRGSLGLSGPQKLAPGTRCPKIIRTTCTASRAASSSSHGLTFLSCLTVGHSEPPGTCTHPNEQQPQILTPLFSKLSLVRLPSLEVYQPKKSRVKIKKQKKNAYEKILKLTQKVLSTCVEWETKTGRGNGERGEGEQAKDRSHTRHPGIWGSAWGEHRSKPGLQARSPSPSVGTDGSWLPAPPAPPFIKKT